MRQSELSDVAEVMRESIVAVVAQLTQAGVACHRETIIEWAINDFATEVLAQDATVQLLMELLLRGRRSEVDRYLFALADTQFEWLRGFDLVPVAGQYRLHSSLQNGHGGRLMDDVL